MSSDAVVKTVAKKLKYYFEVKRLEDGFDLSGVNSPQLDHPPLKSRPTLQYDGLHDRALKHYYSLPQVRVKLTQMMPTDDKPREKHVKKKVKKNMAKHNFRPKTMPEYAYFYTMDGKKIRKDMLGLNEILQLHNLRPIKGGWPLLRSVPSHKLSKGEAHRLVNVASKLLVATETVDMSHPQPPRQRPQSAPKPFETSKPLPGTSDVPSSPNAQKKNRPRPSTAKYTWDIDGRRHLTANLRSYDDSYDSAYTTRSGSGSSVDLSRKKKEDSTRDTSPPARERLPSPSPMPQPPPPVEQARTRPKSAKRRQRTIIQAKEPKIKEDVSVSHSTQTGDNVGIQTEKRLIDEYDMMEDEVKQGPWAEYQVYVGTGDRIGASTKADVKLTLYGDKGRTKQFLLEDSKRHKVKFQKGKEDLFILPAHHVGTLKKVKIGHDRTELSCAWFLEGVTVYDMHEKRIFEFPCERWLSGQDGDRKTYRILPCDRDRAFIEEYDEHRASERDEGLRKRPMSGSSSDEGKRNKKVPDKFSMEVGKKSSRRRRTRKYSDSDSDSSSSSSSYTTSTTEKRVPRDLSPPRQPQKDDFFDRRQQGPTFTFRKQTSDQAVHDSETTDRESGQQGGNVSVETESSSSRPEQEFLEGYKMGLGAVEEEKRRKQERENEERKRLLRGPTIHEAAQSGNLQRIQELLQEYPEMKESRNEKGYTPLHLASQAGQIDVVKWLAANNALLNVETPTGYTAIHLCAQKGHVNCMMVLAAMGAAITCRSTDKKTPLYLAAMEGHLECVKWLVANRAKLDVKDDMGRTPRDVAKEYRHDDVASFLQACEDELADPESGFTLMRSNSKRGFSGLQTIEEDSRSQEEDKDTKWVDDKTTSEQANAGSDGEGDSESQSSLSHSKDIEEKRKQYDEQHKKMEKTGDSFLDSIRHEVED